MNNVFYIGASGLNAQQSAVDITANNLANMNTAAFKRGAVSFSELLVAAPQRSNAMRLPAEDIAGSSPAGVSVDPSLRIFSPGTLHETGNAFDLAIKGEGFIELNSERASGEALLWRGGTLHVGTDGFLAAPNGQALKSMISVPRDATSITVGSDGQVLATVPGQADPLEIGQIELVMPGDTRALQSEGNGVYRAPDDGVALSRVRSGEDNAGTLVQGYSEASNVSLSDELVNLMMYQHAYAANARLVQVGDELMSIANGLKR
ncbi:MULTISPECIES: flagellar hook-basal body protein [unclassified Caballeronia]|uniref:flagellar hook-basal body protein n=1 Tax=unclassified Caballeronia TaxID=2646786 RepID=UPI002857414E|nr:MULTISPECIES: flagellar hook-basal body protein [unclassified Caballeronia]MDR5774163.1 flagellar hook-basal body protein [Caballeronia sp. LZ002]MDR5849598.1 flagellar hook-basal body protein [Caballeronia sp. LZ003]